MTDSASNAPSGRFLGKTPVERLLAAIGYPVRAPEAARSFTLLVDGLEISANVVGKSLRLSYRLTDDAVQLPRLAAYSAGRMLIEDAVLAFGSLDDGHTSNAAFLWQELDGEADAHELRRFFELFADSCDWWRSRVDGQSGASEAPAFPEVMIRP